MELPQVSSKSVFMPSEISINVKSLPDVNLKLQVTTKVSPDSCISQLLFSFYIKTVEALVPTLFR